MAAGTHIDAERELAELSDDDLKTRLAGLEPSEPGDTPDPRV